MRQDSMRSGLVRLMLSRAGNFTAMRNASQRRALRCSLGGRSRWRFTSLSAETMPPGWATRHASCITGPEHSLRSRLTGDLRRLADA